MKSRLPSDMTSSKRLKLYELIVLSMLGVILFVQQVVLGFLPNIELVSVLVIVYARVYGWKVFYPIYIFVALEALYYGITTWVIHYLYVWAILAVVAILLRKVQSLGVWVLVNTAFGFLFGPLCALTYFFMGGVSAMISYWVGGVPFDLLHMAGNFITALVLCGPLYRLLTRLKQTVK